jgi:hypothetical protein
MTFLVSPLPNFPYIESFSISVSGHFNASPSLFTIGSSTFILLGPLDPNTFVSYYTTPYCYLKSSVFPLFFGFSLLSNK